MAERSELKWWQKPVRMGRFDCGVDFSPRSAEELEEAARWKKEEWHINCEWVVGTVGAAPGLGYVATFEGEGLERLPSLKGQDLLRTYLPHARKYGIRVLAYLNMHWFSNAFADAHPGWEQTLSDGRAYGRVHPLYGDGTTFCVNSPWREWAFGVIREAMKTGIDGVFLDGPVVFPGCCSCAYCREKFGRAIPEREDWSNPAWKEFVAFREDSMVDFLRDAQAAALQIHPDGVIFLNAGSWHSASWRVARDVQKLQAYQHFNGAEAFFHPGPKDHPLHFWAIAAKYLRAGQDPAVVFVHHCHGAWHFIGLPEVEMQVAYAQIAACGANPWFAYMMQPSSNQPSKAAFERDTRAVGKLYGFLEEHEEYYADGTSAAKIGLIISSQTSHAYVSRLKEITQESGTGQEQDLIVDVGTGRNIVDWEKRKRLCDDLTGAEIAGTFLSLSRAHLPFDVVLDEGITAEGLKRYDALILPNTACLSDAQAAAIAEFVREGGGLLASFEAGEYDERGDPRTGSAFREVIGIERVDRAMVPAGYEEYLKVREADHPALDYFGEEELLPRPVYALEVTACVDRETPLIFMNPINGHYKPLCGESKHPALIAGRYGKGKVIYFPHLVGKDYGELKGRMHEKLIADSVRAVLPGAPQIEVDAPPTVEVELWTQENGKRLLIHLVNNTGDMQRPMSQIMPVGPIRVTLRSGPNFYVYRLSDKESIVCSGTDMETTTVVLPELDVYEVIVCEW